MEVEYRVAAAEGPPLWIRDTAVADGELVHGYLVDITREKELEQELARERATLDAFFRESTIGLAITDGAGRYVRINDALAELNGAPAAEHLGRRLGEVAPDTAAVVEPLRASVSTAATFRVDLHGRHVLVSYMPFELDGERYTGRVVVDLTEQKRAEEAEEQYRRLLEQLPLAAYVNDIEPRHRARYVTPRIEEITGYGPDEFLAQPELGDKLIHPDEIQEIDAREEAARREGRVFEHEYRIIRADGMVRWVLDRMETVFDDEGAPLYEQGFLVDVTEGHETANLLRAVWDGAFEAIVIADDRGRCVDANPAACELFGRTREELLGLLVGDVLELGTGTWQEFRRTDGVARGDAVIRRPDGTQREVEYAARADFLPGRHLSVMRDATEHRQMQRELWRAQKLESVARLAGGVAHDFNNLLTAIRGYAQLLQMRVPAGTIEAHHALEIDRAADRAAALTAQLLSLGRRQTLQARPVDLNRHLEELRDSLVELAGPRNELTFELEPGLRAVRIDPTLFAQAVRNLVGNAAEAIDGGGRIVVRTENVEVEEADDLDGGNYVVLSVVDSGRGLDEATLEHVFEPFFTTKELGEGRGLGLASAYGTVRQSGGTITVESVPGQGSTFSIHLPEAAGGVDVPLRDGTGETVLVVERDPAVRDVVFEVLTDAHYRVLTSRTGADAVRLAERLDGPIDLLLSELDGARLDTLTRELRAVRPSLRAIGLEKPYTPERLRRSVRAALDSLDRVTATADSA
jgi:PAS domain S-box-containing protein